MSDRPSFSQFLKHATLGLALAAVLVLNVQIAENLGVLEGVSGWVRVGGWCIIVFTLLPYMEWVAYAGLDKYHQYRGGVGA